MSEKKIWKPVVGYSGKYYISNFGRVHSYCNNRWGGLSDSPIIMKQTSNEYGYKIVSLCRDGRHRKHRVHRLVAEAFIPNLENKEDVNHIDGDKKNNRVNNLEWVTRSENIQHSIDVLGNNPGAHNSIPVRCVETGVRYESSAAAARDIGANRNVVLKVVSDKYPNHKTVKGYRFVRA